MQKDPPCKYAESCRDFTIDVSKRCLRGGGTACRVWRMKINEEIAGPIFAHKIAMKVGY